MSESAWCSCITCGDTATEMTVLRLDRDRGLALCQDVDGERRTVELALVEAATGDRLLVHADVAIARLEAARCGG